MPMTSDRPDPTRSSAGGRLATRLLAGACFLSLAAVVAGPLLGDAEPRVPVAAKAAPAVRAQASAADAAGESARGRAVPIDDPFLVNEKVYQLLARDEASAPPVPPPATDRAAGAALARATATEAPAAKPVLAATPAAAPSPTGSEPAPRPGPQAEPFVGVWGTHPSACSAERSRGYLLAAIDEAGAWAGTTRCDFRDRRRTAEGWAVTARCSSPKERWTARVRLRMDGARLHWSSQRGSQTYVRCERRLQTAQAS